MRWYVFAEDYGLIFECPDDTEGKNKTLQFITTDMPRDHGIDPEDARYWVVRGEEREFVPPSSKGDLI